MLSEKIADAGLTVLQQAGRALAGVNQGADSLVGYTAPARVEPLCLIDDSLMHQDMLPVVLQSLLAMFTGYYLQAFALSANVGNVNVVAALDKLNPNRDPAAAFVGQFAGDALGLESYFDLTHRLPVPGDKRNKQDVVISMEDDKAGGVSNPGAEIKALTNLSVGKLVNVEIKDGTNKAVIAVSIRLLANAISSKSLTHILSAGGKDTSFKERLHQVRSGEIQFVRDLILCQDLIDEHKKHLANDRDGFYQAILRRRTGNALAGALTGNFSVATASNLVVISDETATQVEVAVGGRLKDFRVRQKIFEKSYLMILVVVNATRSRATFYHRGIPESTEVSERDMKAADKGSGPDLNDMLAAYRLGNSPSM
jgi:hypothetical protein